MGRNYFGGVITHSSHGVVISLASVGLIGFSLSASNEFVCMKRLKPLNLPLRTDLLKDESESGFKNQA